MGTIFKTKEVSMKWLKRLISQWSAEGRELWEEDSPVPMTKSNRSRLTIRSNDIDSEDGLNITVRKAIGGKIITFRTYDQKTDRHNYRLYVVPDDLDFDKELGKMITLESIRM
jgi:hypothetical protein